MTDDLPTYLSSATALALVAYAIKVTWQITRVEKSMRDELHLEVSRLEKEANERGDLYRQQFGETCAAIRQKIHEIEVFSRDYFVNKDSFKDVIDRFERTVEKLGADIKQDFRERLEDKFDQAITNRFNNKTD